MAIVKPSGEPPHSLVVRRADGSDCGAIAEVHVRTWQAAYQHVFPPEVLENLSVDEREARWRQRLEDDSAAVWVAQTEAGVVGFASAAPSRAEGGAGELYSIYVLPDAWGNRAGHELMTAAKAWFAGEQRDALGAHR